MTQELRNKLAELKKQQIALEAELEKAEKDERLERTKPFFTVATKAHNLFCAYNHTDGCGWLYENDAEDPWANGNFGYSAHRQWLEKVMNLCNNLNLKPHQLEKLLDNLAGVKEKNENFCLIIRKLMLA